jgi:uncharacterized protein YjdB
MRIRHAGVIAALLLIAACHGGSNEPTTPYVEVVVEPTTVALRPGQTAQLKATVTGPGRFSKAVTWVSNDMTIATVTQTGLVRAIAEGATIVRAVWDENPEIFGLSTVQVTSSPVGEGVVR